MTVLSDKWIKKQTQWLYGKKRNEVFYLKTRKKWESIGIGRIIHLWRYRIPYKGR